MRYAHAQAITEAQVALDNISDRAAGQALRTDNPGGYVLLAEAADQADDALTRLLIIAKVYLDDAVAGGALDA